MKNILLVQNLQKRLRIHLTMSHLKTKTEKNEVVQFW